MLASELMIDIIDHNSLPHVTCEKAKNNIKISILGVSEFLCVRRE